MQLSDFRIQKPAIKFFRMLIAAICFTSFTVPAQAASNQAANEVQVLIAEDFDRDAPSVLADGWIARDAVDHFFDVQSSGGDANGGYLTYPNGTDRSLSVYKTAVGDYVEIKLTYTSPYTITDLNGKFDFESPRSRYDNTNPRSVTFGGLTYQINGTGSPVTILNSSQIGAITNANILPGESQKWFTDAEMDARGLAIRKNPGDPAGTTTGITFSLTGVTLQPCDTLVLTWKGSSWRHMHAAIDNFVLYGNVSTSTPSTVQVDDDWSGYACNQLVQVDGMTYYYGIDAFSSVQKGINAVAPGGSVNIAAGTYIDSVLINKPLTLAGAGQSKTTIHPDYSKPVCDSGDTASLCQVASNLILVEADNVTIHDLTLDGDNPALVSSVVRGGADLDARNGILTNYLAGNYNNLEVYNTTVRNIYLRGIQFSGSAAGKTFSIHDNTIQNVQGDAYSIAMFNRFGSGSFVNNNVDSASDGIASNWSSGTQYLNNTITNSGMGVHSDNNGGAGGSVDLIQGNTVSDCTTDGYGLMIFAPYLPVTLTENTVSNCAVGLTVAGQNAAVTPVLSRNVVNNQALPGSVGVYVTTSLFGWGSANAAASFSENQFSNAEQTFYLEIEDGYTMTLQAAQNSLVNYTAGVVITGTGSLSADFSTNWWGTEAPSAVRSAANNGSGIDFTPWLGSSTDSNAVTPGFQPLYNELWVDDDSPQTGSAAYIGEAVIQVTENGTIFVVTGTYTETLSLDSPLNLVGVGLPELRPESQDAFACTATGSLVVKGFQVTNADTVFNLGAACNLTAYANNLVGFNAPYTTSGGDVDARHNWWGSNTPVGLGSVDYDFRLGAPVADWAEGSAGDVTLGNASLDSANNLGTAVIISHGRGADASPFDSLGVSNGANVCSDYYDFFLVNPGSGDYTINITVDDTPACRTASNSPLLKNGLYYYDRTVSGCNPGSSCWWAKVSGTNRDSDSLFATVNTTFLEGTALVIDTWMWLYLPLIFQNP